MNARAILVTGAARGIGRATALAFAAQGDRVAVHHRGSPEEAKAVLAELPAPGTSSCRPTSPTRNRRGAWSTRPRSASAASTYW